MPAKAAQRHRMPINTRKREIRRCLPNANATNWRGIFAGLKQKPGESTYQYDEQNQSTKKERPPADGQKATTLWRLNVC
jgi:hypothetical protein